MPIRDSTNRNMLDWFVTAKSVRGNDHIERNIPKQDALGFIKGENFIIMALADGHGASIHFRSQTGAEIAVNTAKKILLQITKEMNKDLVSLSEQVKLSLAKQMSDEWNREVDDHLKHNHFTEEEAEMVRQNYKRKSAWDILKLEPKIAYGSTLISVLLTDSYLTLLQIGDGDILTVGKNRHVVKPLPDDTDVSGNETKSLCMNESWREFRSDLIEVREDYPVLIITSTDGFSKSYPNKEDFFKIGPDLLDLISSQGTDYVEKNLESMLTETSSRGSWDDITVGIIFRKNNID